MNGWWVNLEHEGVEGKARKQRQAEMRAGELWDYYNVVTISNFSDYILSRLWCKQLNREQFLP